MSTDVFLFVYSRDAELVLLKMAKSFLEFILNPCAFHFIYFNPSKRQLVDIFRV